MSSGIHMSTPPPPRSGGGGGGDDTPSTGTPGQPTGNGGTRTWNNFKGRDPDLIFTGETLKLPNGETYVVRAGDTLTSIAGAKGITLKQLMDTNGFDADLLGPNSSGDFFTSGSPQPAPGGSVLLGAPSNTQPKFEPPAPAGPNGNYTKEQAETMAAQIKQLQQDKKISDDTANKTLDLLNQLISAPDKFTPQQKAELDTQLGKIKAEANAT